MRIRDNRDRDTNNTFVKQFSILFHYSLTLNSLTPRLRINMVTSLVFSFQIQREAMLSCDEGLLLVLYSGLTFGKAWGTNWGASYHNNVYALQEFTTNGTSLLEKHI